MRIAFTVKMKQIENYTVKGGIQMHSKKARGHSLAKRREWGIGPGLMTLRFLKSPQTHTPPAHRNDRDRQALSATGVA
jgi:hypothetical protein